MTDPTRRFLRRLRALVQRDTLNRDVVDEMRTHIDMEANELARTHGLPADEARRRATIAFGGVDRFAEAHQDARGVRWFEDIAQDVRYATRALRRSPSFTITATLVLALGIGASTAIFSAVDAVLVSRLPYPADDRLVRIYRAELAHESLRVVGGGLPGHRRPAAKLLERRCRAKSRRLHCRWRERPARNAGGGGRGFFATLGVRAARGRLIGAGDSGSNTFVAVVAHDFARREFGGDGSNALGKTVTIDGVAYAIVGVLQAGVKDLAGVRSEVWSSLTLQTPQRRGPFGLRVVARMRDGVSLDAAREDLDAVSERTFPLWASSFQDRKARLTPYSLRQTILGNAGQTLGLFGAAVALVLLIAIANVASLTLVRVTSRSREAVLRTVLGASSGRVARLLVTESVVLAALGATAGAILAPFLLRVLVTIGPPIPRLSEAGVDIRAIGFAAALALVTGILVGLYPAIALVGRDFSGALRSGDREIGAGRSTHMLRGALVTAQFALALPLLATAALLLNSFVRLQRVGVGFDPRALVYVHVSLPAARYGSPTDAATFWTRVLARVGEQPGVVAAGLSQAMPPDDPLDINNFDLVDRPVTPGDAQPTSPYTAASAGFFAAAGVPLLEGRMFTGDRYRERATRHARESCVGAALLRRSPRGGPSASGRWLHDVSHRSPSLASSAT